MEQIKAWSNGKSAFIELPLEILKFAQENHPTKPCKILDISKMGQWFAERILEHGADDSSDAKFYQLIDDMFYDALESGEEWIDYVEPEV